jgi:hypothetical protein
LCEAAAKNIVVYEENLGSLVLLVKIDNFLNLIFLGWAGNV